MALSDCNIATDAAGVAALWKAETSTRLMELRLRFAQMPDLERGRGRPLSTGRLFTVEKLDRRSDPGPNFVVVAGCCTSFKLCNSYTKIQVNRRVSRNIVCSLPGMTAQRLANSDLMRLTANMK
jgi:hypothetical protein